MRKSIYLLAGIIGLGLTACDDTSDLGQMQVNEKPTVIVADGVAIANLVGSSIDLAAYENEMIPVADAAIINAIDPAATVAGNLEISVDPAFPEKIKDETDKEIVTTVSIPLTSEAAKADGDAAMALSGETRSLTVMAEGNSWEKAFQTLCGLDPATRTLYVRYRLFTSLGSEATIIYADKAKGEVWFPTVTMATTPIDYKYDVDAAYNFIIPGQTISMSHSDKHVYDDPNFVAFFEVPEGSTDFTWQIQSASDPAKIYGVPAGSASDLTIGRLQLISEGGVPAVMTEPNVYKLEVDMITKIFKISLAPKTLYVMSLPRGMSFKTALQLGSSDYITYRGFGVIWGPWGLATDGFKLCYKNGDKPGTMKKDAGAIGNDTGMPIVDKKTGLYWISANIVDLKYIATPVTALGLTGDFNDWGADAALKPNATYTQWTGEFTIPADKGLSFKIRCNEDWKVTDFGGQNSLIRWVGNECRPGNNNMEVSEPGTYSVKLDLSTLAENGQPQYTCTLTKK